MSDSTHRIPVPIHLCEECGKSFKEGLDVVCLSDGYVEIGGGYEVENRRFFHRGCWVESDYMGTGNERNQEPDKGG